MVTTSLSERVAGQIAKDAELLRTGQIEGAMWHFFRSPGTGEIGPSGPLLQRLKTLASTSYYTNLETAMAYSIIQPPFTLEFREMSKEELKAYNAWFHSVLPERIAELTRAVKSTPGFEFWKPDLTPESLDGLGRWFEGQVEVRRKSREELEEIRSKLTIPIDIPEEQLTNRTFSLAMDIGMYFSQVILKNLPGIQWDQPLKSKNFADYGQPVLIGFGSVPLNPVAVNVTTAYRIKNKKPARLRELYDTWAKMTRS